MNVQQLKWRHALQVVLILCSTSILWTTATAQSRDNYSTSLKVAGHTLDPKKGKVMKDVTVTFKEFGKVKETIVTDKSGAFEFDLAYDKTYTIEFASDGYVTQTIDITTKGLDDQDRYYDYEYSGINMRMMQKVDGVDFSMFDAPVMKLEFHKDQQGFIPNPEHAKQVEENKSTLYKEIEKAR